MVHTDLSCTSPPANDVSESKVISNSPASPVRRGGGKGAGKYIRHLFANEKSFRFLAGRLLLPVDKESVSSYFGTPLLFVFAWLIMGIITKEPLFFENLNRAGKHVLQHKNIFLRPTPLHISQKSSTFAPAVDNWVVHI